MNEVTRVLAQIEFGDPSAADKLLPLVYDELRKLAAAKLVHEKPGQTLQATGLVHEAYLRLVDNGQDLHWDNRRHFFAAAAESMRRILVENARRKKRLKRGGQGHRVELTDIPAAGELPLDDVLALNDALEKLKQQDPEKSQVVLLRFFAGLTHEQVAAALGVSEVTSRRHWRYARAWLRREMGRDATSSPT